LGGGNSAPSVGPRRAARARLLPDGGRLYNFPGPPEDLEMPDNAAHPAARQPAAWPNYREDDFVLRNYVFGSGETLAELRLHYRTIGTEKRDAAGRIVNGVLLLQGNTGTGANWFRPSLADELFRPGQPLDPAQYFIIMPDAIGRGGSSKPSDGLKGKFPHYRYRDMVESGYRLITEGLGVGHLRLVIGSSMGGMHAWMWAEMYPDLMDGVVPLSCQPIEISGRNWISRRAAAEAIRHDPEWNNGDYEKNPSYYIWTAAANSLRTESATRIQEMAPTRAAADALYAQRVAQAASADANDQLWAIEAIMDYNPEPDLDKIKAKVLLINAAEDEANPPELGTVERAMQRVRHGRYVLIPAGAKTHGHFTHFYAEVWKPYLAEFINTLDAVPAPAEAAG
jgi:homoserine O-acetyltransferase